MGSLPVNSFDAAVYLVTIVAVSMGFNAFRRPAILTAGANLPGADMNPCAVPLVAAAILLAAAPALKAADLANEPARDARQVRKAGKAERWRLCGSQRTMAVTSDRTAQRSGTPRCVPLR